MERKPHSTGSIVGAVVLLVFVLLGLYVGGYFALGEYTDFAPNDIVAREYRYDWLVYTYRPMARIESATTGKELRLASPYFIYLSNGEVIARLKLHP